MERCIRDATLLYRNGETNAEKPSFVSGMHVRARLRHAGTSAKSARSSGWTYLRYRAEGWIAPRFEAADELRLPLDHRTAIQLQRQDYSPGVGCRRHPRGEAILGGLCAYEPYRAGRAAGDLRRCKRQRVAGSRTRRQCACRGIPPYDLTATVVGRGTVWRQSGVGGSGPEALLAGGARYVLRASTAWARRTLTLSTIRQTIAT